MLATPASTAAPRQCSRLLPLLRNRRRAAAAPSRILLRAAGPGDGDGGSPPPLDADEALLMEDLRRYGGGNAPGPSGRGPLAPQTPAQPTPPASPSSSSAKDLLDKALIADFFFILAALAWLIAGVGVSAGGGSTALLDAWYGMWPMVFQPAIGALMAGALISGALGWLRSKDE